METDYETDYSQQRWVRRDEQIGIRGAERWWGGTEGRRARKKILNVAQGWESKRESQDEGR